jgi:hypothetical protein
MMRENYTAAKSNVFAQNSPVYIHTLLLTILLIAGSQLSWAQCGGCTSKTTNANFTVGVGQVFCLNFTPYTDTITLNGGTLCISSGITCNATFVYSAATSIYNSGTIGTAMTIGNGYTVTNTGSITAAITLNNGGTLTVNRQHKVD